MFVLLRVVFKNILLYRTLACEVPSNPRVWLLPLSCGLKLLRAGLISREEGIFGLCMGSMPTHNHEKLWQVLIFSGNPDPRSQRWLRDSIC